jgi:hypothetical protein
MLLFEDLRSQELAGTWNPQMQSSAYGSALPGQEIYDKDICQIFSIEICLLCRVAPELRRRIATYQLLLFCSIVYTVSAKDTLSKIAPVDHGRSNACIP